jgi:hypothetical protein
MGKHTRPKVRPEPREAAAEVWAETVQGLAFRIKLYATDDPAVFVSDTIDSPVVLARMQNPIQGSGTFLGRPIRANDDLVFRGGLDLAHRPLSVTFEEKGWKLG